MSEIFQRLGSLACLLDEEVKNVEARFRVLSSTCRSNDGLPAEKSLVIQREIQTLKAEVENLIQVAETQIQDFDGFLKTAIETYEVFDENIKNIEERASNYGYVIPDRPKVDLKQIMDDIEVCTSLKKKQIFLLYIV